LICYVGAHLAAVVFVEDVRFKLIDCDPKLSVPPVIRSGPTVQEYSDPMSVFITIIVVHTKVSPPLPIQPPGANFAFVQYNISLALSSTMQNANNNQHGHDFDKRKALSIFKGSVQFHKS
jgi:hypothetical protein